MLTSVLFCLSDVMLDTIVFHAECLSHAAMFLVLYVEYVVEYTPAVECCKLCGRNLMHSACQS